MSLDKVRDWLHRCYRCGNCKLSSEVFTPSCPSGENFRFESYYPSGRIWIGKALYDDQLRWSPSIAKKIYACNLCGACSSNCRVGIRDHSQDILESLREVAVAKGFGPMPEQKLFTSSLIREHNPYNEPHFERLTWLNQIKQKRGSTKPSLLYFVGCTSSYRRQEIAKATVQVLEQAEVKFTVSKDEWCCGSPLLRTGQTDLARKQAEHNVELINKSGSEFVLTSCAGCYRAFVKDYETRFGLTIMPKILHVTQFLQSLLNDGTLEAPSRFSRRKFTYHDPCHLGRHSGVYDPPRDILKKTGAELLEMKRTRENAWCCGSGGGVKSSFPEMALKTAISRLEEAKRAGADTLVSACPFCKLNFVDAATKSGDSINVVDIVELFTQ